MQWIIEEKDGKTTILPAKLVEPQQAKKALSPLAWKILKTLAEKESYPKEIAKNLKMHEQKIYYHIRNLEKAGLVMILREEMKQGAMAKIYTISEPAIALSLKPLEPATKLFSIKQIYRNFLDPFIKDGTFNAKIVVGSPEPHGPTKEKGKDSMHSANIALFFGTFSNYRPKEDIVMYDTNMKKEDLKNNLILIGGPGINSVTREINDKLPIRFVKVKYRENWYDSIYSSISNKTYSEESCGLIVKIQNPFDKTKAILIVAGRRFTGTKACSLAFMQKLDDICAGNSYKKDVIAKVVSGIDANSDGIIDTVEILE